MLLLLTVSLTNVANANDPLSGVYTMVKITLSLGCLNTFFTCLGHLGWHNTDRIIFICVTSHKVAKAIKEEHDIADVFVYKLRQCTRAFMFLLYWQSISAKCGNITTPTYLGFIGQRDTNRIENAEMQNYGLESLKV
jgi:hypothetical protein